MNRNTVITTLLSSAFGLALAARAESQTDSAPQEAPAEAPNRVVASQPRIESVSYLGIASSMVPPALREHLRLAPGVGLIVDHVDPGSPADRVGLKANDVIEKLDDQIIINAHQFTVLVRMHKPGETVKLQYFRQGKSTSSAVILGQKDLPVIDEPIGLIVPRNFTDDMPLPHLGQGRSNRVITHVDTENTIAITMADDHKSITIRDRDDKLVYSGDLNTPEDRLKIPENLRGKVESIERGAARIRDLKPPRAPDRDGGGDM